ncbi:MAG: hypothetical protein PHN74_00325 [Candidatus Pacebacteria bacterium]|nr:hypothetical protein [Candidatus Paceibacterota bacterium]
MDMERAIAEIIVAIGLVAAISWFWSIINEKEEPNKEEELEGSVGPSELCSKCVHLESSCKTHNTYGRYLFANRTLCHYRAIQHSFKIYFVNGKEMEVELECNASSENITSYIEKEAKNIGIAGIYIGNIYYPPQSISKVIY